MDSTTIGYFQLAEPLYQSTSLWDACLIYATLKGPLFVASMGKIFSQQNIGIG